MHFQTKVLIVSVLIVCVMAGALVSADIEAGAKLGRALYRQRSGAAERLV